MIVYIVNRVYSDYEEYSSYIVGIYTTEEKANAASEASQRRTKVQVSPDEYNKYFWEIETRAVDASVVEDVPDDETYAYSQGGRSYYRVWRFPKESKCPYKPGTDDHRRWTAGFEDAKKKDY